MFGRVPNKILLKLSTWQFSLQQRKRFGSISSLDELGVVPSIVDPILVYCDNNGAVAQAMEPRSHQRDPNMFSGFVFDLGDHW